jgi:SPP1 gp7 family putative phage head morphogenesis protein
MSDYDRDAVAIAIDDYDERFTNTLVSVAELTFVFASLFAFGKAIKKKVIPNQVQQALNRKEISTILSQKVPAFTQDHIEKLMPIVKEEAAPKFVNQYKADLMKGGRNINIGSWSPPDAEGVRTYLGYERKWVPWLDQFKASEREQIYGALTSGKPREEIVKDLNTYFDNRESYSELVARTEVLNNSRIIQKNRWGEEGITKFMWICSSQPNSPCEELCAEFCGNIYTADDLPMGGELCHANCMCSVSAVVEDIQPESWDDLEPAQSSQFAKDLNQDNNIKSAILNNIKEI